MPTHSTKSEDSEKSKHLLLTTQNTSLLTQARGKELVAELSFWGIGQIDGEGDKSDLYFYYNE